MSATPCSWHAPPAGWAPAGEAPGPAAHSAAALKAVASTILERRTSMTCPSLVSFPAEALRRRLDGAHLRQVPPGGHLNLNGARAGFQPISCAREHNQVSSAIELRGTRARPRLRVSQMPRDPQ